MNKLLTILIYGIIGSLILTLIPFGNYMVDDRWVYEVDDMSEIYPELKGHTKNVYSGQSMDLNFWQYVSAERNNALGKRLE